MLAIILLGIAAVLFAVATKLELNRRHDRRKWNNLKTTWRPGVMPGRFDAVGGDMSEVTSIILCDDCEMTYDRSKKGCPACGLWTSTNVLAEAQRKVRVVYDGEPLPAALASPPNIGGEGNPDYAGPHYESLHEEMPELVPYDVLREPIDGAAVFLVDPDGNKL